MPLAFIHWIGDEASPQPPPRPSHDLPLFPFHPIVVPPGGAYPPYYPPRPGHDLPLFPFHPIVVPPGGAYPPYNPPYPSHELPLFPFNPIVVPPGGVYPKPPTIPGLTPEHPINLPPYPAPEGSYWIMTYVPAYNGWQWVLISPQPLPPSHMPAPKEGGASSVEATKVEVKK